ncbi:MAG TPA: hypothetical protein VK920_04370 [Solirubrobacterales bacterium]|nr:hypothetical protein [Solirubrobacterales bacterium]
MSAVCEPGAVERALAVSLAAGRAAIGAGIWLAPRRALPALGFDRAAEDDEALTLARIAATRDLVLGVWQASVLGDRERLRRATLAVAAADAGDALAFAIAARRGGRPGLAAKGLAGALPATFAGAWLAARLRGTGT